MTSPRSDVTPWTREQIEAWVRGEWPRPLIPGPDVRAILIEREFIVRFFPEALDYDVFSRRHLQYPGGFPYDRATATREEIGAALQERASALWQQSLSEPGEGEAP